VIVARLLQYPHSLPTCGRPDESNAGRATKETTMFASNTRTRFGTKATAIIGFALAGFGIGCTAVPDEVGPMGPVDCNDLIAGGPTISLLPQTPLLPGENLPANQGFRIQWFAQYQRGFNMNYLGFTGDYVARVTIHQGAVEVYSTEIDATPLNVASGDYDAVIVEDGLPAGDYLIRIALDVYGEVDQCNDLVYALNNISEREVTVDPDPIDDVAVESDDDESPNGSQRTGASQGS
jgi:hypothetical protein